MTLPELARRYTGVDTGVRYYFLFTDPITIVLCRCCAIVPYYASKDLANIATSPSTTAATMVSRIAKELFSGFKWNNGTHKLDKKALAVSVGAGAAGLWLWRWYTSPRLPPGPRGWPLVGHIKDLSHLDMVEIGKKYGDIFTVWVGNT